MARAADYVASRLREPPQAVLVLGSGLGALADDVTDAVRIPFGEIPGFARPTVAGHRGMLVAGRLEGLSCLVLQGRYHLYEGHAPADVVRPVRTAAVLGARTLMVTCAAGGLDPRLRAGDLMLLDDHVNVMGRNPLIGPLPDGEPRFPDMAAPYDAGLQSLAQAVARAEGIRLQRGTYCALTGPSYETRAEVRMLARFGDAVGMSTVPEVLAARSLGMRVLGLALITNPAAGLAPGTLDHDDVVAAGTRAADRFGRLVRGVLRRLAGGMAPPA
ncbi:MAG TPA: purine-nucleoside phosphorylase [Longimicrobiales bacterium]|nr:purine-nucleoside phosphorylase [Longimicrobiales bacterium]